MKYVILVLFGLTLLGGAAVVAVSVTDTYVRDVPNEVSGFHQTTLDVSHRSEPIPVHVWYPAAQGGQTELIAQNALFFGEHVLRDAAPKAGTHPVVVVSHGSGGNGPQLGWLATRLAKQGAIVVATDHPGTRSRDSDPHQTVKIWHRPRDLSALLSFVIEDAPMGLEADVSRVASLGFSLGGPAALHLAGLRYSKDAFIAYCTEIPDEWDCGWFNENGVDFAGLNQDLYEASYRDDRVSASIAIDAAIARAATPASVEETALPVLLINMANEGRVPEAMMSANLAEALSNAEYAVIPNAWHFSFLQECSRFGKFMISLMSEDNICGDIEGKSRGEVHLEVFGLVSGFLNEEFGL